MNNKNIFSEIAEIFGLTTLIIIRIKGMNVVLQIILGIICTIICIFFIIQSNKYPKENSLEEMNRHLKILDWAIYLSYFTIILILLFI